ncbi:MAG: hypothetical protein D8M59_13945 [Planctomycetes bacterium]|nr:hypothetical protein [Planctomycetota bacterium]
MGVQSASAQVVTVTIAKDTIDVDPWTATIDDLPGPDGEVSFSEAMIATNNTPGHQTVAFNVPQALWPFQWLYPGRLVLTSTIGYYWRANDSVTIDGTTQTAFTGDSYADGNEVVIDTLTFYLNADDSTFIGFDHSAVSATANNALIEGNTGNMRITVYGGSGSVVRGNEASTIVVDRSTDNRVVGNTTSRIRVLGYIGGGQPAANNIIGGPNPEDRNYVTGYGSYNSEGMPNGSAMQLFDTVDCIIENNWIGTTPDGLASGNPACTIGIKFEGENYGTIVRDNMISGILGIGTWPHHNGQFFGWAVYFQQIVDNVEFTNNAIGLDANGDPTLGSVTGIEIGTFNYYGISDLRLGGSEPGQGNVIAGHMFNGITIGRDVPNVRIAGNSIYGNGGLGIDLVPTGFGYGVTPNDPLDADSGANGLQNFPVLTSAATIGDTHIRIAGDLHTSASSRCTVEFFASPECDPSGHGEGQIYLGMTEVLTDGAGDAAFDVMLAASVPVGWFVSSTAALEPVGATSEFSACVDVTGGGGFGNVVPGTVNGMGGSRRLKK